MRRKVRIVSLPKAGSGMEVNSTQSLNPGLGYSLSQSATMNRFAKPDTKVNRTLKAVPREEANLEAEKGETAFTDLNGDGIPEQYMIGGKRHYDGGTPLYLPDNSFIFSRDRTMKIKDPTILAQFGMSPAKSGYTPADIAKKYDINKFRKVLGDSDSDPLQRKSAEAMISNYNMKLGKLAIVQESTKGFPNGIPAISMPYIEQAGIDPASFVKAEPNQNQEQAVPQNQTEAQFEEPAPDQARYGTNVLSQLQKRKFGGSNKRKVRVILPQHQVGGVINEVSRRYVDSEPEIYYPDNWRERNKDKKQGSHEDQFVDVSFADNCSIYASCDIAISTYKSLLNAGVCPEQARMVLPQNMMTEWYWSGTLYFFSRVCNLRLSKDVQLETRLVAQQIKDIMLQHFPISCKYILK